MLLSKRGKPLFAFSFSFVFDKKAFIVILSHITHLYFQPFKLQKKDIPHFYPMIVQALVLDDDMIMIRISKTVFEGTRKFVHKCRMNVSICNTHICHPHFQRHNN